MAVQVLVDAGQLNIERIEALELNRRNRRPAEFADRLKSMAPGDQTPADDGHRLEQTDRRDQLRERRDALLVNRDDGIADLDSVDRELDDAMVLAAIIHANHITPTALSVKADRADATQSGELLHIALLNTACLR